MNLEVETLFHIGPFTKHRFWKIKFFNVFLQMFSLLSKNKKFRKHLKHQYSCISLKILKSPLMDIATAFIRIKKSLR